MYRPLIKKSLLKHSFNSFPIPIGRNELGFDSFPTMDGKMNPSHCVYLHEQWSGL